MLFRYKSADDQGKAEVWRLAHAEISSLELTASISILVDP